MGITLKNYVAEASETTLERKFKLLLNTIDYFAKYNLFNIGNLLKKISIRVHSPDDPLAKLVGGSVDKDVLFYFRFFYFLDAKEDLSQPTCYVSANERGIPYLGIGRLVKDLVENLYDKFTKVSSKSFTPSTVNLANDPEVQRDLTALYQILKHEAGHLFLNHPQRFREAIEEVGDIINADGTYNINKFNLASKLLNHIADSIINRSIDIEAIGKALGIKAVDPAEKMYPLKTYFIEIWKKYAEMFQHMPSPPEGSIGDFPGVEGGDTGGDTGGGTHGGDGATGKEVKPGQGKEGKGSGKGGRSGGGEEEKESKGKGGAGKEGKEEKDKDKEGGAGEGTGKKEDTQQAKGKEKGDKGEGEGEEDKTSDRVSKEVKKIIDEAKSQEEHVKPSEGKNIPPDISRGVIIDIVRRASQGIGVTPSEIEELVSVSYQKKKIEIYDKFKKIVADFFGMSEERLDIVQSHKATIKYGGGQYFIPRYKLKDNKPILIIFDTSGSVSSEVLEQFINFILNIARDFKFEAYYAMIDAALYLEGPNRQPQTATPDNISSLKLFRMSKSDVSKITNYSKNFKFRVKGGGGTVFKPLSLLEKVKNKSLINGVILLTDGYVEEFPSFNPLRGAKWLGIYTDNNPGKPSWITWKKWDDIVR